MSETSMSTIISMEEWVLRRAPLSGLRSGEFYDDNGTKYIESIVKGFIDAPIVLFNSKEFLIKTKHVYDIKEFKDSFELAGTNILLYSLTYNPMIPYYRKEDSNNEFGFISCEPYLTKGYWKIKYVDLF